MAYAAGPGPPGGDPAPGESSRTLDRGIRLLEALARPGLSAGLTITELASELGVGRPVVYRLVRTLEAHRLAVRRADGRVRLGAGVSRLADAVTPIVRGEATPVLRRLADAVGATAHVTIAQGDQALALVVVEPSWTDLHVAYREGARHRLDQGAAGRAIVAGRAGRHDPVASVGELQPGAHGLAVPVAGADACVGVVSLTPIDRRLVGPELSAAATRLESVLR